MVTAGKKLASRSRTILLTSPITIQQLTYLLLDMEEESKARVTMEKVVERLINDEVARRAKETDGIVRSVYGADPAV